MKQYKCLSGATLKNIALITMVIDHFNKAIIIPRMQLNMPVYLNIIFNIFDILGRFAFPIFCFLMVEGFYHTRSKVKYLRNLIVFALISEIPFNLYFDATFKSPYAQNIFFTLSIAFVVIWAIDECKKKINYWIPFALIFILLGCSLASKLGVDYDFYGVLVPTAFYLFRKNTLLASIIAFLPLIKTPWALVPCLMTNFYNGERGKQIKWLNYWIYPVHLLILGLIRYFTI